METFMSSTSPITFCSAADKASFLVPARGFQKRSQCASESARFGAAVAHAADLADRHQVEPAFDGETFYQPIYRKDFAYLSRIACGNWDVQSLLGGRSQVDVGVPKWIRLAYKGSDKPEGSYNVALLVEGQRQRYSRWSHRTRKHPKWWYRLSDGQFDCCAVWGRKDGTTLGNGFVVDDLTRFYAAARSARGAIYARRTNFDDNGAPNGYTTGLILVEFSILDKDPAKDDMLKVEVVASRVAYSHTEGSIVGPYVDDLDAGWQALAVPGSQLLRPAVQANPGRHRSVAQVVHRAEGEMAGAVASLQFGGYLCRRHCRHALGAGTTIGAGALAVEGGDRQTLPPSV